MIIRLSEEVGAACEEKFKKKERSWVNNVKDISDEEWLAKYLKDK